MALSDEHGMAPVASRVRVTALSLLFLVSLFNYLDRYMFGVLLPAIKADLRLNDSELGFISGFAFTLFYAAMGIPIGRLADRHPRRLVIAGSLAVWSAMTALCGLAQGFFQLAAARIMIGVGESGATPPSHSLISDLFPARGRAGAISLFSLGSPFGIFLGFLAGGFLVQSLGWRPALFVFGLPGLILASVVLFALPEPPRGASDGLALTGGPGLPLGRVAAILSARKSFRHVSLGSGLFTVVWLGLITWLPSFFTRTFGLPIGRVGATLAWVLGGAQLIGLATGGVLGDVLAGRDGRWYLWLCTAGSLLPIPFYAIALLAAGPNMAFIAIFPAIMLGVLQSAPALAVVQGVAGVRMRAVAVATYLVIVNLIAGVGSPLIGLLSDWLRPSMGSTALGAAILIVALPFSLWSSWHFWLGARTVREDFAAAATG